MTSPHPAHTWAYMRSAQDFNIPDFITRPWKSQPCIFCEHVPESGKMEKRRAICGKRKTDFWGGSGIFWHDNLGC